MKTVKKLIGLSSIWIISFFPFSVSAQIDCSTLPHWVTLSNGIKFNQLHVFCGEYNGKPKGFHSRPGDENPSTVASFTIQDKPNAAGIYTGKWRYIDHPEKQKFSSMFPDSCTQKQVLNSITYASSHPEKCPSGSPGWVQCGKNRPNPLGDDTTNYCNKNGDLFSIGFTPPRNNIINTAFPIRK